VVLETRHGLLVEALVDAGFTVVPVNPDLVAPARSGPEAAADPFGNRRVGFEGCMAINRKDWGLRWNVALETGGLLVSERVNVELDISAIKAS
jgi:polyisoprenoid-binding protein YceI